MRTVRPNPVTGSVGSRHRISPGNCARVGQQVGRRGPPLLLAALVLGQGLGSFGVHERVSGERRDAVLSDVLVNAHHLVERLGDPAARSAVPRRQRLR
jgi:hypothetical protein